MTCAPYDLRDYYFEALSASERRQVKEHAEQCPVCAAELDRLRVTTLSLAALPDEEIPRRIGFVSDKVFEPSLPARWWASFWNSGLRMASAAALVLAGAIVFHGVHQPAPTRIIERVSTPQAVADPVLVRVAVDKAVAEAVAKTEARYDAKIREVQARTAADQRNLMIRMQETLDVMEKRHNVLTVASNDRVWGGQ
jgi:hypothetical protein